MLQFFCGYLLAVGVREEETAFVCTRVFSTCAWKGKKMLNFWTLSEEMHRVISITSS